jgi:transposase-like protein
MTRAEPQRCPAHCPNPRCISHADPDTWRFKKKGFFLRGQRPFRIQRYLCLQCGRNFSSQTFSTTYWLKRAELLETLFLRLLSCSGLRQIARELGVSHSTLQLQSERLGRHCLLFHEQRRPQQAPREELVLDGFRSFEHSQYWPYDLNLLIGRSHFVYGFNDAELRRSGTMRPAQRLKRACLEKSHGRPDPRATRKAIQELIGRVVPPGAEVILHSDEHHSYPQALKRLSDRTFHHEQTSSRKTRTTQNPLFPVNLADLLLRHCSANHKRETIAFSKRRQGALYRAAIWMVWRNYVKLRSENRRDPPPAVALGITRRAMTVSQVLRDRCFPERVGVSGWVRKCYFGRIRTRRLETNRSHRLRCAV